ncbi:MAG: hypothetical protein MUF87_09690, partial [Anaerolineae bacterium]|nr:hypothetical protein [Anaerolineae bacterium]
RGVGGEVTPLIQRTPAPIPSSSRPTVIIQRQTITGQSERPAIADSPLHVWRGVGGEVAPLIQRDFSGDLSRPALVIQRQLQRADPMFALPYVTPQRSLQRSSDTTSAPRPITQGRLQRQVEAPPPPPSESDSKSNPSAVDEDALADKVLKKFMQQLTLEQQRRGGKPWHW